MTRPIHLLIIACLCLAVMPAMAEVQTLDCNLDINNKLTGTIDYKGLCRLILEATPGEQATTVRAKIINLHEQHPLLLAKKTYNIKEKKDQKNKNGTTVAGRESLKNDLKTDYYRGKDEIKGIEAPTNTAITKIRPNGWLKNNKNIFILNGQSAADPTDMGVVATFRSNESARDTITFIIYTCAIEESHKKSGLPKKIKIASEEEFKVVLSLETGPDTEFEALKGECEKLIDDLTSMKFCPKCPDEKINQQLSDEYNSKIIEKIEKIRELNRNRGYVIDSDMPQKFKDLKNDLMNLRIKDRESIPADQLKDCGKHGKEDSCKSTYDDLIKASRLNKKLKTEYTNARKNHKNGCGYYREMVNRYEELNNKMDCCEDAWKKLNQCLIADRAKKPRPYNASAEYKHACNNHDGNCGYKNRIDDVATKLGLK